MATQLLIYEEVVPVNKQRHVNWSIKAGEDYFFAKNINSVPIVAVEFPNAAEEYPIVFAGDNDNVMPVVLLGIKDRQNLFLNEAGQWDAKYIPAFIRRYPFVFARSDDGATFTLCLDEKFSGCNQENRGERLFDVEGARTQYLESTLRFVNEYQAQYQRTQIFCKKLAELELLESMQAQFTLSGGQRVRMAGFMAVSRERLKRLPDDKVAALFKTDELELIYMHLQSMRNFTKMLNKNGLSEAQSETANVEKTEVQEQPEDGKIH